jgi:hypothetical protein
MINLKEYIVTLVAMFLSLGIGIMVGTSITESVVVEQQKNIIEQLESRYYSSLQDLEELHQARQSQESLLELYDQATHQLVYMDEFESLVGREVAVFSLDTPRGLEVSDFLKGHGLKVNPHIYSDGVPAPEGAKVSENAIKEVFTLARQLLLRETSVILPQSRYAGLTYEGPLKPEAFVVVAGGVPLSTSQSQLVREMLEGFPDDKIIILEDYFLENSLLESFTGQRIRGIDYIDTAAGKIALLALLQGSEGISALKPLLKGQP